MSKSATKYTSVFVCGKVMPKLRSAYIHPFENLGRLLHIFSLDLPYNQENKKLTLN